ncbi:hypothetical protein KKE19_00930 [Patescibacteria group bacterium]|nr:hypothetical protein [Patescibacteria group bacterium]MBU4274358.1 hypothetical protein [Patescibacteria group bacterium]MBU4367534.1 hypothetical protein [Patescibacteria group bacterium]MBU4461575.1 hypothetical protein [Patescibacteria group bacterium]MCG2699472.1 hypothetical protein [Candidatus Parcubacteria bacterium]
MSQKKKISIASIAIVLSISTLLFLGYLLGRSNGGSNINETVANVSNFNQDRSREEHEIPADPTTSDSPSLVIKHFYAALKSYDFEKRDCPQARKYLSSDVPSMSIWENLARLIRNGEIEKIKITKEEIQGKRARVYYTLYFKDGGIVQTNDLLRLENNYWKLRGMSVYFML